MKKNPSYFLLITFIFVSACFLTYQITYTLTDKQWRENVDTLLTGTHGNVSEELTHLTEAVSKNYLYPTDEDAVYLGIMNGYVSSLPDNFSMYMDESQYRSYLNFENAMTDVGIGVSTLYDSSLEGICVINVHKSSPAENAGIVPGDLIIAVNDSSVKNLGYYGVMEQLGTGNENEKLSLTIKRLSGEVRTLELSKSRVSSERIEGKRLGNHIGLIRIGGFEVGDEEKFKLVMSSLITGDCEKFVIDIRNNSGGSIEAVSRILDFLMPEGSMFSITDKSGATNTMMSDANSVPYPLAVLVNGRTVCGAEIFASVLSTGDTTRLFGTTTYGKASNQSIITLPHGDAVSLSVTKYLPSSLADFDKAGITPDEVIELPVEKQMRFTTLADNEDDQLTAAIEYLKTQKQSSVKD